MAPDEAVQQLRMESLKLVIQAELLLDALGDHQKNLRRFLDDQKASIPKGGAKDD